VLRAQKSGTEITLMAQKLWIVWQAGQIGETGSCVFPDHQLKQLALVKERRSGKESFF
jgi:hypothetical protein